MRHGPLASLGPGLHHGKKFARHGADAEHYCVGRCLSMGQRNAYEMMPMHRNCMRLGCGGRTDLSFAMESLICSKTWIMGENQHAKSEAR